MPPVYDSVVIGSGPSGSSAAYELSRRGAKVLILEKAKLPRYKTCGGGIPLNFFKTLPAKVQETQEALMENCLFFGPGGRRFQPENSPKIAGVLRERFDHAFALAACDAGAELIDENPVTGVEEKDGRVFVKTKRGNFESRFLVGADGASGVTKRWTGLNVSRPLAAALEVEIERNGSKSHCERSEAISPLDCFVADAPRNDVRPALIHFTIIRDGYAWVFPKGNLDSVGIASFNRDRQKVKQKLTDWIRGCGYELKGEVIHGHPIPVWSGKTKLSTQRALLVGDAAGTVDPLVGEGIRYGILSGRIAAEFIQEALKTGFISQGYTQAIYREIHSDFNYARLIAGLFYRFPNFCFQMWVRSQSSTDKIGKVLFGELRYRDIFYRVCKGLVNPTKYLRLFKRNLSLRAKRSNLIDGVAEPVPTMRSPRPFGARDDMGGISPSSRVTFKESWKDVV
jgi:geranylgeranyl reductase family protein